jgi:putative ABC transport system permease protein
MDTLLQDIRFALRALRRSPGFTAIAVACLALGIGVNTTVFSFVNATFLRPLPFAAPERLVAVNELYETSGNEEDEISYPNFLDWTRDRRIFAGAATYDTESFNLSDGETPEYLSGGRVETSMFDVLGVRPVLGRGFAPEEGTPGRSRVVVIGHDLWERKFASDPRVLGRALVLNGEQYTIVGVMPRGFRFPEVESLWVPHALHPTENRGNHSFRNVARLADGVAIGEAQASLAPVTRRLQAEFPETNTKLSARLVPYRSNLMPAEVRAVVLLMFGAVSFVLLIACANVANLLLARATGRQRELAVRAALGASRGRILRQLLTESVLVALAGGGLGVLIAHWGLALSLLGISEPLPYYIVFEIDRTVLLFTLVASVATGILFGILPAWRASRPDLHEELKEGTRGAGRARHGGLRGALVVSEVSLAVVLLAGAMLMVRSFLALQDARPGFDYASTLTTRVRLAGERYADVGARVRFVEHVTRDLAGRAEVEVAAATHYAPLSGSTSNSTFDVEGRASVPGEEPAAITRPVTTDYFAALRLPVRGRTFTALETADTASRALIVNETLAARIWPGEDAIGKRIRFGGDEDAWLTVVGVAPDVRQRRIDGRPENQVYFPYAAWPSRGVTLLVRARSGDPTRLTTAVMEAVRAADPTLAPYETMSFERLVALSFWQRGLYGWMFGAFAVIALVLACIGVYGVMSYGVAQRTHEIGVRMALGAQVRDVVRLVLGQGMRIALVGVAVGLLAAAGVTRALGGFLYGVSAVDPLTFVTIPLVLVGVALLAIWVPARRAARVAPTVSLRYE